MFKLICHQGWKEDGAKGNSLEAFKQAKAHGYDTIECDTRLTTDGIVVLSHDETVNGCTIQTSTYAEVLSAIPYILKFDDLVDWCVENDMRIYIDVKDWNTRSYIATTLKYKNAVNLASCFNLYESDLADARYGSLKGSYTETLEDVYKQDNYFVDVNGDNWSPQQVKNYSDNGYNIEVYTINDVGKAKAFIDAGAIGITTDKVTYADIDGSKYFDFWGNPINIVYDFFGNPIK